MKLSKFFKYTLYIINGILLFLLIASAFSAYISPQTWLIPSFMGLLFPAFLFLSTVFLIIWVFALKWKAVLCNAIAFIIAWGSIQSYFPINLFGTEKHPENAIKLMTYNVMGFAYLNHKKNAPNPIIEYINKENPDIVCLQEYFLNKKNPAMNEAAVHKAFKNYPYKKTLYFDRSDTYEYGIAVFSKFPITGAERINYKSSFNGSGLFTLEINGKKVALINNHLESNRITQKDKQFYQSLRKGNIDSETLGSLKNNIASRLKPAYLLRAQQTDSIANTIKTIGSDYILVCGDLNDTPISYTRHKIQGSLTDAYVSHGTGVGISYNADYFWFRIDYIFHSPKIKTYDCYIDRSIKTSDHYPVVCYFNLEE